MASFGNMVPGVKLFVSNDLHICRIPGSVSVRMDSFNANIMKPFAERTGLDVRIVSASSPIPNVRNVMKDYVFESVVEVAKEALDEELLADANGGPKAKDAFLTITRNAFLGEEHYTLDIKADEIVITAGDGRGAVFALTTLCKLITRTEDGEGYTAPLTSITDGPEFGHRGLMLDSSRHFFPAEEVKKVIEGLALAKMNILHWHLSDDQGLRIESKKFPKLNEDPEYRGLYGNDRLYYTQEEIRDVVSYAACRGIQIIPEIDLPGHVSGILAAYPELSCTGEQVKIAQTPGIYKTILCPGQDAVFAFLDGLLGEVAGLFPAREFHIGGDEAPKDNWMACPACRSRMNMLGITDGEELQGYFTLRVMEILEKYGKKPIMWNDALKSNMLRSLAENEITVQYWNLDGSRAVRDFAKHGGRYIYSDMFELYFDYPYSMTPMRKVYGTGAHFGKFAAEEGGQPAGFEACVWTEHIDSCEKLEWMIFPRVFALAEMAWSGYGETTVKPGKGGRAVPKDEYEEFKVRLGAEVQRLEAMGIHTTAENWWDPAGKERREEAIKYVRLMTSGMESASKETEAGALETIKPTAEFKKAFASRFFKPTDMVELMKIMK